MHLPEAVCLLMTESSILERCGKCWVCAWRLFQGTTNLLVRDLELWRENSFRRCWLCKVLNAEMKVGRDQKDSILLKPTNAACPFMQTQTILSHIIRHV